MSFTSHIDMAPTLPLSQKGEKKTKGYQAVARRPPRTQIYPS